MNPRENKIIAIHQPNYIPWLGYFYKIHQSDKFVFLDDAQFSNQGMHNYHYIKTPQGSFRLKIPVDVKFGSLIKDVRTKDELNWKDKHMKTFEMNYKKSKFYEEVSSDLSQLISDNYANLADMNSHIIKFISKKLGIDTEFISSSELNLNSGREEKILDICNDLNGTTYYSGTGAKAYQSEDAFQKRGVELRYSVYTPFVYPQLWGEFQSNITIIDYLMNCGYDWDRVLQNQKSSN